MPSSNAFPLPPKVSTAPIARLLPLMSLGADAQRGTDPVLLTARDYHDILLLISAIFDSRRKRPLVVVTTGKRGTPPYSAEELADRVWDQADVVVISTAIAESAFRASMPDWMHVYYGGTRIYRPGADISDERTDHPLITPEWTQSGSRSFAKVINQVHRVAAQRNECDPVIALATEQAAHEATRAELSKARQALSDATRGAGRPEADLPRLYSDPEEQFDHDLRQVWLESIPEYDRHRHSLRFYTLGADFLADLDQQQSVSRYRVIRCCVDVVTGRYAEVSSREAKRFKDGEKQATVLVRPEDGATAWRCYIQNTSPGMRMMWWEVPDPRGAYPELSRVAVHDDLRMT